MATTSEPISTPPPRVAGTTTSGSFARVGGCDPRGGLGAVREEDRDVAAAGDDVMSGEHRAGVGDDDAGSERALGGGDQHHRGCDEVINIRDR
jgi:hypothetical protein